MAFPTKMAGLALAALLATLAGPAHAEEAPRRMSLEEARAFARTHQLRLLAARQRLVAAERDADVPGAQWLPRVGAMAQIVGSTTNNSTTTVLGNSAVDLPRIGATKVDSGADWQPYPSTAIGIGVRQELYDFGRIAAEKSAAVLASEVEKLRTATVTLDVDYGVEQSFFAVLAAVAIEEASRGAFERAVQHRDFARANVQSGMRPPIELTRAEADVARYEAGMVRAQAGVHVARSVLAVAVGSQDLELDASSSAPDARSLPPLPSVIGLAAASPTVLEAKARIGAQRGETDRLEAQTRPNLMVTAEISARAGGAQPSSGPVPTGDGWLPSVPNYSAGAVLTWPILEPFWGRRAAASRAREQAFAHEADQSLHSQRALISAAYHEAASTVQALGALQRGAEAARANYDQADNRFRVGLGTSTELADAQALRTEAEIQLAIGQFQVARTRAGLDRAIAEAR